MPERPERDDLRIILTEEELDHLADGDTVQLAYGCDVIQRNPTVTIELSDADD